MEIRLEPKNALMTAEIQNAIDECFSSGGGKIILTRGLYLIGGIRLRSNCTLYLESGAILKGSRDPSDYKILQYEKLEPIRPEYLSDALWKPAHNRPNADHITKAASPWNNALIRILDAHNVSIIGEDGSLIDGSDPYDPEGEGHYRGPHGISYHHSSNLRFMGYTIKNAGNWAHNGLASRNIEYRGLTVLGGHDGIHNSSCDDFSIISCGFYTGDDCIAGFDNCNVRISDCVLNSACSGLRFGGTDVLVENCRFYGPAEYYFRGSLSLEDRIAGNASSPSGRKNMLSLFTYYSDFTLNVRRRPGNIVVRNCSAENCDRFLHYDFTGTHVWQKNRPLDDISFEGIRATGISMPLNAYGGANDPLTLRLRDCDISFSETVDCAIRAGNFALIEANDLRLDGVDGAFVRCFGESGVLKAEGLFGVSRLIEKTDEPFYSKSI